ncbi:hypothetical protein [Anaerocolumna sp. MB42-C2]|uniref:hypothetical protein n=1 Tax=Anaerocolumna sp. MB42-C2 TaxID=3070997 RepID=UPI0027DFA80F|nr:hypothetical protein [Anaerocolumna sp. MB42-C2]WMJ90471.1 hypothetical protein RBU59_13330 [Anaerocolumna sp. MB42-C2]
MTQTINKKLQSLNELFGGNKETGEYSDTEKRQIKIELLVPLGKHSFKLFYGKRVFSK